MPLIRSISGLRATLGDSLTPDIVQSYCSGFAAFSSPGKIAIGSDGRPSHLWIERVATGALMACGRDVVNLSVVPTPTVQYITEQGSDIAGGIIITASHNPEQWNGLKFIGPDGVFLDKAQNEAFWEYVDNKRFAYSDKQNAGTTIQHDGALVEHINSIISSPIFGGGSSLMDKLADMHITAVVDAVNASGSRAIPQLLRALNCTPIELHCDGSGIFPHTPEPLPVNLTGLSEAVHKHGADIGIAVDPDADRLVLIDENGDNIGEEKTIALAVRSVMEAGERGPVVTNLSTSRMSDDIAEGFGCKTYRSAVGEINVVGRMKETGAVVGGEGSGGVIYPKCHYGRDSLVGTALLMALMARTGKKLSELASDMPSYQMKKTKMPFSGSLDEYIEKINALYPNSEIDMTDGIKISMDNAWVQLRKSNTEPIIRIIAESPNMARTEELIDSINNIMG